MSRSDIFHLAGGTIQANSSQYIKQQGTATASALGYKPSRSKPNRRVYSIHGGHEGFAVV